MISFRRKKHEQKARIFLNSITVVPRSGLKKILENNSSTLSEYDDDIIQTTLTSFLQLPDASEQATFESNDLGLDIIVPEFEFGSVGLAHAGPIIVPLNWRAKLTMTARLFEIETNQTIRSATVKHIQPMSQFLKKLRSPGRLLSFERNLSAEEVERMIIHVAVQLLRKVKS
ncbi:MAG: hypothetical protein AAGG69_13295 [Pseudomonadota bacterium]